MGSTNFKCAMGQLIHLIKNQCANILFTKCGIDLRAIISVNQFRIGISIMNSLATNQVEMSLGSINIFSLSAGSARYSVLQLKLNFRFLQNLQCIPKNQRHQNIKVFQVITCVGNNTELSTLLTKTNESFVPSHKKVVRHYYSKCVDWRAPKLSHDLTVTRTVGLGLALLIWQRMVIYFPPGGKIKISPCVIYEYQNYLKMNNNEAMCE